MKLSELVKREALVPQLQAATRDEVINEMVDALVVAKIISADMKDELIQQITDREQRGSTGFGKGVAVPHVKHAKIKEMAASIGVSSTGVDFNALDKAPVYSVVLLLSPIDRPDEHLQAMEHIFRNLQNETFRRFLRQASTQQEIMELLEEADAHQLQD